MKRDTRAAIRDVRTLAQVAAQGMVAVAGVYMRMCDLIRSANLTDDDIRSALVDIFPQSRISEILRVARAPDETYRRYRMGMFGFKAALAECRGYRINPTSVLTTRRIRRAAERLVKLSDGPLTVRVRDRTVVVS